MRRISFARHRAFYIGALAGLVAASVCVSLGALPMIVAAANAFFLVYLGLMVTQLPRLSAAYLREHAAGSDEPVWVIFLVTLVAAVAAVVALFLTVNTQDAPHPLVYALTLSAVPLGWFTIHMMAALHYAHVFWQPDGADRGGGKRTHRGGLEFPGTPAPDGLDFLYFAYVVGMTAQTSDVGISNRRMRMTTVVHSIVSFFFNTVLVAAAVNIAVALGAG
jgi:uncharacterized membrane protein